MSHTRSLGLYRARHWQAAAIAVEVGLHARHGSTWDVTKSGIGSLQSVGRFFYWTLDGVAQDRKRSRDPKVPTMAGISCLSTTMQILKKIGRIPTVSLAEKYARNNHDLIRRIQHNYQIVGSAHERRQLRKFLQKLIELGS